MARAVEGWGGGAKKPIEKRKSLPNLTAVGGLDRSHSTGNSGTEQRHVEIQKFYSSCLTRTEALVVYQVSSTSILRLEKKQTQCRFFCAELPAVRKTRVSRSSDKGTKFL